MEKKKIKEANIFINDLGKTVDAEAKKLEEAFFIFDKVDQLKLERGLKPSEPGGVVRAMGLAFPMDDKNKRDRMLLEAKLLMARIREIATQYLLNEALSDEEISAVVVEVQASPGGVTNEELKEIMLKNHAEFMADKKRARPVYVEEINVIMEAIENEYVHDLNFEQLAESTHIRKDKLYALFAEPLFQSNLGGAINAARDRTRDKKKREIFVQWFLILTDWVENGKQIRWDAMHGDLE